MLHYQAVVIMITFLRFQSNMEIRQLKVFMETIVPLLVADLFKFDSTNT